MLFLWPLFHSFRAVQPVNKLDRNPQTVLSKVVIRAPQLRQPPLCFALLRSFALLAHQSGAHPVSFHVFAHSLRKTPGMAPRAFLLPTLPKVGMIG
jgi:hypothetical protein